ncbi:cytochrome b5 reductase 4-like isoform X3 [Saccostrea echinata]|uniref:cytochrome b5 reductase 4-like isoform X3 n=1 Tax=Saccostrea echinata TaxID=191078 RepID=UPI002A81AA7E|nr:cytochrome b5 reductase 4-like isoform X3 [Saccostrea echinata]
MAQKSGGCFLGCWFRICSSKSQEKSKKGSPTPSSSSVDYKMAGKDFLQPSFPAPNSQQRLSDTKTRNKVALKPGRSLMDWIRLGRSGEDLTGVGGKILEVDAEELAKHNRRNDAWIALRGKVYNITPYMEYHPGGDDELMRGAGIDGTQLFDEVHKWVNYESMLEKCFVGKLKSTTPVHRRESLGKTLTTDSKNGPMPPPSMKVPQSPAVPKFDWFQTKTTVTLVVYTKWKSMKSDFVVIDNCDNKFLASLYIEDYIYYLHIELAEAISLNYEVTVNKDTGKTEILLTKEKSDQQWSSLGKNLEKYNKVVKVKNQDIDYRTCSVDSVCQVTHDSKLLCLSLPVGTRMCVPIGYHVHIKHKVSGMEVVRSYTAVLPTLTGEQDKRVKDGRVLYLMIKIYKGGALTPWIDSLSIGDLVEVSTFTGDFDEQRLSVCHDLVMFAAGTGFTPMVRLINHCVEDPKSIVNLKLLFFNKKEEDILWYDQLQSLAEKHDRFSVEYILSEADNSWCGKTGRITLDLMKNSLPQRKDQSSLLICACGPTQFTNLVTQFTKELGHSDSEYHAFQG